MGWNMVQLSSRACWSAPGVVFESVRRVAVDMTRETTVTEDERSARGRERDDDARTSWGSGVGESVRPTPTAGRVGAAVERCALVTATGVLERVGVGARPCVRAWAAQSGGNASGLRRRSSTGGSRRTRCTPSDPVDQCHTRVI